MKKERKKRAIRNIQDRRREKTMNERGEKEVRKKERKKERKRLGKERMEH